MTTNSFELESKQLAVSVVDGTDHGLDAEGMAMLSALTSRSQSGPKANLKLVEEKGAAAFMEKFYIGYGHGSIGKCGTTNVFVSGLSMIAINHLQNLNPLYAGQESSTRYIPFSNEGVYLPPELEEEYRPIVTSTMEVYEQIQPMVKQHLLETLSRPEGVTDATWDRTINARVFDICRSVLPAGCKTVGVWNGNLENFRQVLLIAMHHANEETVNVSKEIYKSLQERYPSSFPDVELSEEEEVWYIGLARENILTEYSQFPDLEDFNFYNNVDARLFDALSTMEHRPKYAPLPDSLGVYGRVGGECNLDFGGFRDLNRHRKGNCRRGYLSIFSEFHPWYLSQMPEEAIDLVDDLLMQIRETVDIDQEEQFPELYEYIVPMGIQVATSVSYPFDNAVYVAELRSGTTVHPTVREVAQSLGRGLEAMVEGYGLKLYVNQSTDDALDVRRADQDVFEK